MSDFDILQLLALFAALLSIFALSLWFPWQLLSDSKTQAKRWVLALFAVGGVLMSTLTGVGYQIMSNMGFGGGPWRVGCLTALYSTYFIGGLLALQLREPKRRTVMFLAHALPLSSAVLLRGEDMYLPLIWCFITFTLFASTWYRIAGRESWVD